MEKWYNIWFNSPYYHILYANRDHQEAADFIDTIAEYFHFKKDQKALDAGCGRGRHAIYFIRLYYKWSINTLQKQKNGVQQKDAVQQKSSIKRKHAAQKKEALSLEFPHRNMYCPNALIYTWETRNTHL